jgi:tetratricopeptide (TPR) repeat protein
MASPEPSKPSPPTNPFAWRPSEFLTPDEVDSLQRDWASIEKIRGILATEDVRFETELRDFIRDQATKAYQREVAWIHRKGKWVAAADLAKRAVSEGFRSDMLYRLGADALLQQTRYQDARDFLLQGEDLLSHRAKYHYDLARLEYRLGNLEEAKERLKRAIQRNETLRADALDDRDLEPLWKMARTLPKESPKEPAPNGPTVHSRPASLPSPEEVFSKADLRNDKGLAEARKKLAEAKRLGIPLHELIPVN